MAVLKVTKSGKGVQLIDDLGNVYQTSIFALKKIISMDYKLIKLSRLPFRMGLDRFPQSELYNPNGLPDPGLLPDGTTRKNDYLSPKQQKKRNRTNAYKDKVI